MTRNCPNCGYAIPPEEKITLVRAVQTCYGCPSQWDAWDADGTQYYLRFRWGHGSVHDGDTHGTTCFAEFDTDDMLDGVISLADFCEKAGIALAEGVF